MQDRLAMLQTMSNKGKYELAYQNKSHEIWDNLWKEKHFKEEEKIKENKAYEDAAMLKDINEKVIENLAKLDPTLSEEGINLYK
jgi:hypothetical protein